MRRTVEFSAALVLFAALADAGGWAVRAAAIDVSGPVIGLVAYLPLLATGRGDWTLAPARWLAGLLGALIVPALVGLEFDDVTIVGGGTGRRAGRRHRCARRRDRAVVPRRRRQSVTGAALVSGGVLALYVASRRVAAPTAHVPVARFEALAGPIRWIMGPALVALGAGVRTNWPALRAQGGAAALAIAGRAVAGIGSALLRARALGLGPLLTAATLTRTLSSPFAILVQTRTGGPVSLAAALAVLTGVIGAIVVPPLLAALRCAARRRRALRWGLPRISSAPTPPPGAMPARVPSPERRWRVPGSARR